MIKLEARVDDSSDPSFVAECLSPLIITNIQGTISLLFQILDSKMFLKAYHVVVDSLSVVDIYEGPGDDMWLVGDWGLCRELEGLP